MSADPKLGGLTKVQLAAFAGEMMAKYPSHASAVMSLQDSLEGKLDKNPQLQNDIIRKLNNNTSATLADARKIIEKDPNILNEVNKDPTKLASLMGIKAAAAPVAPAVQATAPATKPAAPATTDKPAPAKPATPVPAAAPAAKPEPVAVAASKPISEQEIAARKQVADESLKVTQMQGFKEFAARAEDSQSLSQAIDSMMGRDAATPQDTVKALKELQSDPEFFVKANKGIDEIPEQARETVFTEIAANPDLGKRALAGDSGAKSELMMKSTMGGLGGLFGAGPDGKGGLASLFGGDGMKGLGDIIQKIIPAIMDMFRGLMGKFMGGLQSFSQSPDLMRMGNNPEGTRNFSLAAGQALGIEGGQQRVIDAVDPNAPAVPAAQLGEPQPEDASPGQVRKLEAANEALYKRQANAPAGPGGMSG